MIPWVIMTLFVWSLAGCTSNIIATQCHKVKGLKASVCRTTYPTQGLEEDPEDQ